MKKAHWLTALAVLCGFAALAIGASASAPQGAGDSVPIATPELGQPAAPTPAVEAPVTLPPCGNAGVEGQDFHGQDPVPLALPFCILIERTSCTPPATTFCRRLSGGIATCVCTDGVWVCA